MTEQSNREAAVADAEPHKTPRVGGEPHQTPRADLVQRALKHYDEISDQACHWSSTVVAAIKAWGELNDGESVTALREGRDAANARIAALEAQLANSEARERAAWGNVEEWERTFKIVCDEGTVTLWEENERLRAALESENEEIMTEQSNREAVTGSESSTAETCFRAGNIQAEMDECSGVHTECPYAENTLERHWWTRGYAHMARVFRALEAEAENKKLRAALEQVEAYMSGEYGPIYQLWENGDICDYDDNPADWSEALADARNLSVDPAIIGHGAEWEAVTVYREVLQALAR